MLKAKRAAFLAALIGYGAAKALYRATSAELEYQRKRRELERQIMERQMLARNPAVLEMFKALSSMKAAKNKAETPDEEE